MPSAPEKLPLAFYQRDATRVAQDLIGAILVHRANGLELRARIVETEAYLGPTDLASHASKGLTRRTQVLYGPPARAYVYFIYGMHEMFNVVTGREGGGHAVLIRAAELLDGSTADLSGPGKLARIMRITREDNGRDLTANTLFLMRIPRMRRPRLITTRRVGVDYAKQWKDALLRFYDADSTAVSKSRP